jgi:hypothetical protein
MKNTSTCRSELLFAVEKPKRAKQKTHVPSHSKDLAVSSKWDCAVNKDQNREKDLLEYVSSTSCDTI